METLILLWLIGFSIVIGVALDKLVGYVAEIRDLLKQQNKLLVAGDKPPSETE